MLGDGGTLHRAVEEAGHCAAPNQDGGAKCPQNCADGDEDGAVGERRLLHEGSILGGRHGWGRVAEGVVEAGKGREIRRRTIGIRGKSARDCSAGC